MKHLIPSIVAIIFSATVAAAVPGSDEVTANSSSVAATLSDQEVRQLIIQQSIQSYSGNCPCPYNSARNGSRCGGRSAYSRAGGKSPLCFEQDVSEEMVRRYRERNR